jgi:hypothetical protein
LAQADFLVVRKTFAEWIRLASLPMNRPIYTIDGSVAVDYFIRFENLEADLKEVCERTGVPWEPDLLGRYKGDYRVRNEHFTEYYTPAALARVVEELAWEVDYFGYS